MYNHVLYEVKGRIAAITLNQPEKRNPLNVDLVSDLIRALKDAEASSEISAILLTGAGDSFCAGGDLREFQQMRSRPSLDVYDEGKGTAELFKLLAVLKKPLIGAINGAAFGGGCGLACACHIAIASDRARFGCTEVRLGLFPMVILPALRRAVGDRKALEMSLTGQILSAEEARAAGIVSRVVPHENLADEAWRLAEHIAAFSPVALRLGLEGFTVTTDMEPAKAIDHLNTLRVVVFQTEDLHEGATAFLERRQARWKGR